MNKLRGTLLACAVAAGTILVPEKTSEGCLCDRLRRWFSRPVPVPAVNIAEPVVQGGAYFNPCGICTTGFVRRSYLVPRTVTTTQCALEPQTRYVRRPYWDPIACRYRIAYEPATMFARRCYPVALTNYVQRRYLQPVTTCTTPACPGPPCATPGCPTPPGPPQVTPPTLPPGAIQQPPGAIPQPPGGMPQPPVGMPQPPISIRSTQRGQSLAQTEVVLVLPPLVVPKARREPEASSVARTKGQSKAAPVTTGESDTQWVPLTLSGELTRR